MDEIFAAALSELTNFISTDLAMIASAIIAICIALMGYYFIASFFNSSRDIHDNGYDDEEGY